MDQSQSCFSYMCILCYPCWHMSFRHFQPTKSLQSHQWKSVLLHLRALICLFCNSDPVLLHSSSFQHLSRNEMQHHQETSSFFSPSSVWWITKAHPCSLYVQKYDVMVSAHILPGILYVSMDVKPDIQQRAAQSQNFLTTTSWRHFFASLVFTDVTRWLSK